MSVVYDLVAISLQEEDGPILEFLDKPYFKREQTRVKDATPFHVALHAIFPPSTKIINKSDCGRMGWRLWHAYRHYVPLEFLQGFFAQIDSLNLVERAQAGKIEVGFDDWIVARRAEEKELTDRGEYPTNIRKRVSKRRKKTIGDWQL